MGAGSTDQIASVPLSFLCTHAGQRIALNAGRALHGCIHVPQAITDQLRRRGVDVLTAIEESCAEYQDQELLQHAGTLGRVIFIQDIRFKALAEDWQRQGRSFAGLIFGPQLGGTIGQYVRIWN